MKYDHAIKALEVKRESVRLQSYWGEGHAHELKERTDDLDAAIAALVMLQRAGELQEGRT